MHCLSMTKDDTLGQPEGVTDKYLAIYKSKWILEVNLFALYHLWFQNISELQKQIDYFMWAKSITAKTITTTCI